jgi:hypothetical protein
MSFDVNITPELLATTFNIRKQINMKNAFTLRRVLLLTGSLLGTFMAANAQLKVGDNPTNIQKSSILELESTRQGLLLPVWPIQQPSMH